MKKYEILDISGDVGLRAFGKSIEGLFINSAIGMYSLITNLNLINERKTVEIEVRSHSLEGLFVAWLNELIFYFDAYGFIGKKFELQNSKLRTPSYKLSAKISGEDFDPARHESKLLIKAATYHKLKIEKIDDTWETEVIFDI